MFRRSNFCSNCYGPACLLLYAALMASSAWAAEAAAVRDRAVDMIRLADGKQFLGMFAQPPQKDSLPHNALTFYVARDWLRKHQPAYYRKFAAGEDARRREALKQFHERLEQWLQRRPEPKLLHDFIERSLRDVESRLKDQKPLNEADASQLVVLELPAKQIKRWHAQPQNVRLLLGLAWQARAKDTEELPARKLSEQLEQQGIDVEHREPDLSDRFGIVAFTPRQWAAKAALVEFEILGKPRFQGTGGTLVEADGEAKQLPLGDLVGGLLQDQLGDALGDLLNPQAGEQRTSAKAQRQAAVEKALASAATQKATGTRITYLDQDLSRHRVTVTDTFYALMPDGAWQTIWQQSATINTDGEQAQDAEALVADPQVAEIMQTIKGLGLDANPDLFKSALQFGAATQQAMRDTEREFAGFLRGHTRRLIGPPLVIPEAKAQP